MGDEEESEFGQFIADERAESPASGPRILTKEALREALENLSTVSGECSSCATGWAASTRGRSTRSVAPSTSRARRIRQIENQSLKKLQSLAEAQKLRDVA